VRELFDALSTSQEEVEKVKIEHAKAMSGYQAAKSNAEIATWNFQRATLKAPFSGTVFAILGYPGMVINTNAGSPPIVIISTK
jgi:multidrug resistance efflux pump